MFDTFSTIAYAIATGSIGFALAMALTHSGQRSDRVLFFCMLLTALLAHVLGQLLIVSGLYRLAPHLVGAEAEPGQSPRRLAKVLSVGAGGRGGWRRE